MSLTAEQLAARDGRLTASRVACLMTGDEERILNLWRELVGDPTFVDEEAAALDGKWFVKLGNVVEPAILDWYEHKTGHAVTRRGEVVVHPEHDWIAATLDGFDAILPAPIECKCLNGFNPPKEQAISNYFPQMTWQMIATGTRQCIFSPVFGGAEPVRDTVNFDERYAAELMRRAEAFMQSVWKMRPPPGFGTVDAPVQALRVVSMQGNNQWGEHAATWLETGAAAKKFEKAVKEIKLMVPSDASEAHGSGIVVKRNRANALSIKVKETA
jgi:predicted phage-related endonuclease